MKWQQNIIQRWKLNFCIHLLSRWCYPSQLTMLLAPNNPCALSASVCIGPEIQILAIEHCTVTVQAGALRLIQPSNTKVVN